MPFLATFFSATGRDLPLGAIEDQSDLVVATGYRKT
jgi:hypothetical protein